MGVKLKSLLGKRKKLLGIAAVLIAVIIYMMLPKETTVTSYVTEKAIKGNISMIVSASGSIEAKDTYSIIPRVSAKVVGVYAKTGDKVAAGAKLIQLDDADLQSAVKVANYNYNSAIYRRDQLKAAPLVDDNAVKQAQQSINVSYVQLQTAKSNLNNASITAPIGGEVVSMNVKVGDFTSMATPAVIVANTNELEALLPINEIDINKIKIGQKVTLTLDAVSKPIIGEVYQIGNSGLSLNGIVTYDVKAKITDISNLKPKMSLEGEIEVETKTGVIVVPSAAISKTGGKEYVEVVYNLDQSDAYTTKLEVVVGLNNNAEAEIVSGINENDNVVINIVNKKSTSPFGFNFGSSSNK